MALAPHTRLGPYEILAPLGAGGMGEVFRARDTSELVRLSPGDARLLYGLANDAFHAERPREAVEAAMAATMRIDGYSPETVTLFATQELRTHGQRDAARSQANRWVAWVARHPNPPGSDPAARRRLRRQRAFALQFAERWNETRDVCLELRTERPDDVDVLAPLPWVTLRAEDRAEAGRLDAALGRATGSHLFGRPAFGRACFAAALGKKDEAVLLLRDTLSQGFPPKGAYSPAEVLRHHLALEPLHGYPPFEELIKPKD